MFKTITEGKAKINVPVEEKISRDLDVFYNPVMKFNRDISVLLLKALGKKNMLVADIMAASGVRSIRFLKELPQNAIKTLIINDMSKRAVTQIKKNLKLNNLQSDKRIEIFNEEANKLLMSSKKFDYIDIDPFGSPNPFLDCSIQGMRRYGILAVTATDTGALAGAFVNAGIRKYWSQPLKNEFMHETGLRILIRKVQLLASHHDLAAIPILSFYKEHYYRLFFIIKKGKQQSDEIIKQHQFILYCKDCLSREISNLNAGQCKSCKSKNVVHAGPVWVGNLGDLNLITKMISKSSDKKQNEKQNEKQIKFLQMLKEEYLTNTVGFYDIHNICQKNQIKEIPRKQQIIDFLHKKGFSGCNSHICGTAINTNADVSDFIKIIKEINSK